MENEECDNNELELIILLLPCRIEEDDAACGLFERRGGEGIGKELTPNVAGRWPVDAVDDDTDVGRYVAVRPLRGDGLRVRVRVII